VFRERERVIFTMIVVVTMPLMFFVTGLVKSRSACPLNGGVNFLPRASITQSPLSSSARSIGYMRTILPSSTSTKTGPPVVQFVSRWTSPILVTSLPDAT
jgi:hypothetical protein